MELAGNRSHHSDLITPHKTIINVSGKRKVIHYKHLLDKISSRLGSALISEPKHLSRAGKIGLIKSVLQSIPIYSASAACLPKSVINSMERMFANFYWGDLAEQHKRQWVSWLGVLSQNRYRRAG